MIDRDRAVILKAGRAKPVRQGHPWVFSGAVRHTPATSADGDIVELLDDQGQWLARGYLNRRSQICVRVLTWDPHEPIDEHFWTTRLSAAIDARADIQAAGHTAYRLVHAESDFLPGLTVDRYGNCLVVQAGTLGIDRRKHELATILQRLTDCDRIVERSDLSLRRREGLEQVRGPLIGDMPSGPIEIREYGHRFFVDVQGGQKTGFYLDQRENRRRVGTYCRGKRVLNAFSYSGAFAVHALASGAEHVTNLDVSVSALTAAEKNIALNGFDPQTASENIAGDVFQVLRDWQSLDKADRRYDLIILDPPKFAQRKRNVERALRGYKDINMLAMRLLNPRGILASFSCSGLVSTSLLQKVLFGAALDANRPVQILETVHQAADHPIAVTFPEGEYLKGFICRVL